MFVWEKNLQDLLYFLKDSQENQIRKVFKLSILIFKYFLILFYYFLLFRYLFYYCYYLIKIRYNHTVGMALIHAGRHIHGVNKLITGERSNLILWCRSSHYRSLLKQQ